jgi:hypothetical protein
MFIVRKTESIKTGASIFFIIVIKLFVLMMDTGRLQNGNIFYINELISRRKMKNIKIKKNILQIKTTPINGLLPFRKSDK